MRGVASARSTRDTLAYALAWLEKNSSAGFRKGLARFAIPTDKAFGVPMNRVHALARELGRSHELSLALWEADRHEARLLAAYVGEPAKVTAAQMDRWCRDFDNWAVTDTACFVLFDKAKPAWPCARKWVRREGEFQKRAGLALVWALALHDKESHDGKFRDALAWVEGEGGDMRTYVRKAVDMALRAIARRSPALAREVATASRRITAVRRTASREGRTTKTRDRV